MKVSTQCLKIAKKVAVNNTSEAIEGIVYI